MNNNKKIALIVDSDNWAFANIAKSIVKNLSNRFNFVTIPTAYLNDSLARVFFLTQDCDLIHFFWRGKLLSLKNDECKLYIESLGGNYDLFYKKYIKNKIITTAVYDHLYLDDELDITKNIVCSCDAYYVCSNKLMKIYQNLDLKKKPKCVITDGVDLELFKPTNIDRLDNVSKRKIVIGWSGNSAWESGREDIKGANTILKPVIEDLIKEGYPVTFNFADRQTGMIPHEKMPDFYSKIDVYVCVSKMEGTPNPVLESMASGIPVISTDVGIVKQAFGEKQKKFILKERNKECLKEAIIKLINNPNMFKELSQENLESIKRWDWKIKTREFEKFFEGILNDKK